jgi:hypothetical protein
VKYVRSFLHFWYDFVIGDDWRMAVGVALALAITWALVQANVPAWWVMPIAAVSLLWLSVGREARRRHG